MSDSEANSPELEETPAQRRARLQKIFGDVLPETTRDERDPGSAVDDESATDVWLKSQVPPHHGT